ncbi:c-type cytochrome [Hansschlegelia sp. KR7-227]|uniref:c-type cytochrome n=1 Tax=Hansschlegelia sp. KR7-227 TaxID=3400914 RepID=UPI003C053D4A
MDSFQLNKIAGAVLGTLTVVLGVNAIVEEVFHQEAPEKPGMEVAVPEKGAGGAGGGEAAAASGALALLAKADPAKGESAAKKCGACHSFDKGGPAKMGPNLYGVVGMKHGHMQGFGYSDAMKKTTDKTWDFANLDHWLENPKGYLPGTSMSFAGVKNPEERANLLAYLNKNSDNPQPLPKAGEGAPATAGAGAPAAAGGAGGGFEAKVASADVKKGENAVKKCAACHSFDKGGKAKIGPNLYGVVGAKHAHQEGFGYSDAMKKTGGTWDVASLDKWLENPKGYIPGTSMSFAGVKSEDERAAIVAYLNKQSDKPLPLGGGDKKAEAAPAAAPAPAGGDAKPQEQAKAEPEAAKPANEQAGGSQEAAKPAEPAKPEAAPAAPAEPAKPEAAAPAPAEPAKPEAAAPAPAEPAKPEAPAAAPAAGDAEEPIDKRLASADLAKGEAAVGQQCAVCHTLKKGEEASAGPNLYGVVGAKHAHQEGFEYSDAIKGKQGPWDFGQLDAWLKSPETYAPGTMMAFPGVEDPQERANIIAFLNKNSDNPLPTPSAQ